MWGEIRRSGNASYRAPFLLRADPRNRSGAGSPPVVVGLSALGHDPAAAIFVDGQLIAAVEEERLSRRKHEWGFPHLALQHVLDAAGIDCSDIDLIGHYWDDAGQLRAGIRAAVRDLHRQPRSMVQLLDQRVRSLRGPRLLREHLLRHCGGDASRLPRVLAVPHHVAHLSGAVLSAPTDVDHCLVVDGRGEHAATSLFAITADRTHAHLVEQISYPNSLGVFYGAITQVLGFDALADEYKVMGLASYGTPGGLAMAAISELLTVEPDGRYQVDLGRLHASRCSSPSLPWLTDAAASRLAAARTPREGPEQGCDLAAAAQAALEAAMIGMATRASAGAGPGGSRLALTGGVAMNARAVGRLRTAGVVQSLHVPLAPTDAGCAIGAGLAGLTALGIPPPDPEQLSDPFLGPAFDDDEIERAVRRAGWETERLTDPAASAAVSIEAGKVIGWFDGRMEFGERALGARSILGDPRDPLTRARINRSVKRREDFRPFAPAVLEEDARRFFDVVRSRRMGEIATARSEARNVVPAVVHVDGTARPQTVPQDFPAARFRRLIECFRDRTGVPMVVNTSFNVSNEPIVCSPVDALRTFAGSGLDRLYMGSFVVTKGVVDV